jgi:peptidoglycan/LPS O-acetylase OafA/YrhL
MVVLFHSPFRFDTVSVAFVSNSYIFVDLFFVLSGFIMAHAYGEKIRGGMGFGEYLALRLGRLYPLHLFTLGLWVPYILVKQHLYETGFGGTDQMDDNNLWTFFTNLLLIHAMGVNDSLSWNQPSWSISTEFFAYIAFFLFAVTLDKSRSLWFPLLVSLLAYAMIVTIFLPAGSIGSYDHGFVRCLGAFYLGVFLFRFRDVASLDYLSGHALSVLELVAIVGTVTAVTYTDLNYGMRLLSIGMFGLTVYVFAAQNGGIVSRFLDISLIRKIGVWSFSIYMMHRLIQFGVSNIFEFILHIDPEAPMGWLSVGLNFAMLVAIIAVSRQTCEWVEKPPRAWVKARLRSH